MHYQEKKTYYTTTPIVWQIVYIASNIEKVWRFLRNKIAHSQGMQAKAADQHQKSVKKQYKVDDKVWLSTKNIKTKRSLKKLDHKMIGPYKIKKQIGLLYQLDLPYPMRIYDVFHFSLL